MTLYLADLTIEQLNAMTLEELNTLSINNTVVICYGHSPWLLKDTEVHNSLWSLFDTEVYS